MSAPTPTIHSSQEADRHTVVLAGELDMAGAPALTRVILELCEAGASELCLDLERLAFIDSTGLRAILEAQASCAEHMCELYVIRESAPVRRLFELTGMLGRIRRRPPASAVAECS